MPALALLSAPSIFAETIFSVDRVRLFQITDDAIYIERNDLKPGDAQRQGAIVMICNGEQPCEMKVSYKILSTENLESSKREDGWCWDEISFDTVDVRVKSDGSYELRDGGKTASAKGDVCPVTDPAT